MVPTGPPRDAHAAPLPAAAGPTQTVRGEQAFSQGTSNDVLLACTTLDVLLIDVLPASGGKVSVTGTADLTLVGKTATILLDGKKVGTALIKPDGNFAARVKSPPKAKRRTARYQAQVGTTSRRSCCSSGACWRRR